MGKNAKQIVASISPKKIILILLYLSARIPAGYCITPAAMMNTLIIVPMCVFVRPM